MTTTMHRHLRVAMTLVLLMGTAACSGPEEPLDISMKGFPSDVILGSQEGEDAPAPAAPPTFVPPDALPEPAEVLAGLPPVPAPGAPPRAIPPAPPCPEADPFAAPKNEAPSSVLGPPVAGTYTLHNTGTVEVSGANARKEPVPPTTTRTVQKVAVAPDGSFTHEVASVLGDTTTTTTYRTVTLRAGNGSGGISITRIATRTGQGPERVFTPTPAMELVRFPIETGGKVTGAVSDPAAGTVTTYASTVQVKKRVDACGTLLDGYVVRLDGDIAPCAEVNPPAPPPTVPVTRPAPVRQCLPPQPAQTVEPGSTSTFVATYVLGTQYGGITIAEEAVLDSTSGGVGVHREITSVVDAEPPLAKAPG